MPGLFHYTSAESAISILESCRFEPGEIEKCNDPFDMHIGAYIDLNENDALKKISYEIAKVFERPFEKPRDRDFDPIALSHEECQKLACPHLNTEHRVRVIYDKLKTKVINIDGDEFLPHENLMRGLDTLRK